MNPAIFSGPKLILMDIGNVDVMSQGGEGSSVLLSALSSVIVWGSLSCYGTDNIHIWKAMIDAERYMQGFRAT